MKKIFYFIASAIVALGAVACQNEIDENIDNNQQTEGLSIQVTIANQTRVELGGLDADNKRKLTFTEGDQLVARAKRQYGPNYIFTYTKAEGDVYTFTCEDKNVSELIGTQPYFFYLGGLDAEAMTPYGIVCNTPAEDITGIGMYASDQGENHNYKNLGEEGHVITLKALPLLKFTAHEPVTFTSEYTSLFFDGNSWTGEYITKKTGDIYLPVMASNLEEITITVTTESGFDKSFTKEIENNKIYNLGTIEAPVEPAGNAYLVPGVWNTDGAWFAAYFFNKAASVQTRAAATDAWVKMTDADANGVYECEIPGGFNSVIFCRMNPAFSDLAWDEMNGDEVVKDRVWNQSADLTLPLVDDNNRYCYINGWDVPATWGENPFAPETPGVASKWCVAGGFNSWGDTNVMVTTTVKNLFVAKNITLAAYGEFKIKVKGTWDGSYGAGDICYLNQNVKVAGFAGSNTNFQNVVAGKYDIYFDALSGSVYLMTAGTDYTTATAQTTNGSAPDTSNLKWGLCGVHNNWGATADIALTWDSNIGMYVAKNAKLTGKFKVRANQDWATSFGSGGSIKVNNTAAIDVYNNGGDMTVASGTYDVYFWYDTTNIKAKGKIWVKTPGSAAPTL
jgi:hypothetical protein